MKTDMPITKVEQFLAVKRLSMMAWNKKLTRLYRTWKFRGFKKIIKICCEQKPPWVKGIREITLPWMQEKKLLTYLFYIYARYREIIYK